MFTNILENINNIDKPEIEVFEFPNIPFEIKNFYNKKLNFNQFVLYKAFSQKNIIYNELEIRNAFRKLFSILSLQIFIKEYEFLFLYIIELADTIQSHELFMKNKKLYNNLKKNINNTFKIIDKNIFYKYYTVDDIFFSKYRSEKYRENLAFNITKNIKEELLQIALHPSRLKYFLTNDQKIKYGFKLV